MEPARPEVMTATRAEREPPSTALAATLRRIHRRLRPWHLFVFLAAGIIAMILAIVLVHVRDQQRQAALIQLQAPSDPSIARVNLGYARYHGTILGNGISQYQGLRFAAPPTGDLRWRAPVEPSAVAGYQAADAYGKICLGISASLPSETEGEDCLFANVWAPANATLESKLPVWLFIQGGGYTVNSNANWNGSAIVERSNRNIVLVNFNYRVGLWGFLASERVRANGDLNVGLLDQRMMMKWVKQYIAQFGGDPDHVIINGVSAGAGSVALHLTANGGKDEGLFHGAIAESTFFPAQPLVSDLEWQFDLVINQTDCVNSGDPMGCLRGQSETALQATNVPSPFPGRPALPLPLFYWTPCIDGELLEDFPYVMYEHGHFIDVPIVFGTNTDEGTYFGANASTELEVISFLQNNYPHLTDTNTTDIMSQYPLMQSLPLHNAWFPTAAKAYGEATFICPSLFVLDSLWGHSNSSRTWAYRYNVLDPVNYAAGLGVPHAWETWAVWGPDSISGVDGGPVSYYKEDAAIVPVVMDYWISFVRTLDPTALKYPGAPAWGEWGDLKQRILFEAGNVSMEVTPDDSLERCDLWKSLATITEQ
ncbi:carboxylesterase [Xylariales sp. AK1849]|nr:carboxylesterase [Xylariales sp. AK1849]